MSLEEFDWSYVLVSFFNLTVLVGWFILAVIALFMLRRRKLPYVALAVWAAEIVIIPIIGALAFWIVSPGKRRYNNYGSDYQVEGPMEKILHLPILLVFITACSLFNPTIEPIKSQDGIDPPIEKIQIYAQIPSDDKNEITEAEKDNCIPELRERIVNINWGPQKWSWNQWPIVEYQNIVIEGYDFPPNEEVIFAAEISDLEELEHSITAIVEMIVIKFTDGDGKVSITFDLEIRGGETQWTIYIKHNNQVMCQEILVVSESP
jgi:energy-coupling factor transporter transmembrane protein EcfT